MLVSVKRSVEPELRGVEWGIDTETVDGRAVLIALVGPDGFGASLVFPESFREIFEFITRLTKKSMAFNMDYDARSLIHFLPKPVWKDLYRKQYARWNGYVITYKAEKEFIVRRGSTSFTIYDCYPHFQRSLARATEEVFGQSGKAVIPAGWYRDMGRPLRSRRRRIRVLDYCFRDADSCRRLWAYVDDQFRRLGIPGACLERPLSPGYVASAYFGDKVRFPKLGEDANWLARKAYAGGRIEVFKRGSFDKVYVYDKKSAYPSVAAVLPDPRGLDVVRDRSLRDDAPYSVYKVRISIPEGCKIPPIASWAPDSGGDLRIFPCGRFREWVTGPEVSLLMRHGWLEDILDGIHLCGQARPWLTDVPKLFRMRKTKPELDQAIKLILNSLYGKLAQKDDRMHDATYIDEKTRVVCGKFMNSLEHLSGTTNYFVAAYITALTRVDLWERMKDVGFENIILAATDGLVSLRPLPRKYLGVGLGEWEEKAASKALIVGTGVYSLLSSKGWDDKIRGYKFAGSLREMLAGEKRSSRVRIFNQHVYTLKDWATRDAPMNAFTKIERRLNVNFDRKRIWERPWERASDLLKESMGSGPRILLDNVRGEG